MNMVRNREYVQAFLTSKTADEKRQEQLDVAVTMEDICGENAAPHGVAEHLINMDNTPGQSQRYVASESGL